MNKFYAGALFLILSITLCQFSCSSPTEPKKNSPPDTTSHNFTWTQYTFGGSSGSSYFKDVTVVSDSDIWAAGSIHTDSGTYNAAHWNGDKWELKNIMFYSICGQQHKTAYPINSIIAFNKDEIWASAGDQIAILPQNGIICLPFSFTVNKMWGRSSDTVYVVGNGGNILRYSNFSWMKMESGTTIDLRDVWGSSDGKTVWACGYSNDEIKSILLKYDGTSWKTLWHRDGNSAVLPYRYFVTSVWGADSLILSTGRGVYKDTTQIAVLPWYPYRIRGSAENNIAVAGDEGMIRHYNGASWKELNIHSGQPLYSLAISANVIAAVGVETSIGFGSGLIYLGQR